MSNEPAQVIADLKNSLNDLERVRMTAPNEPALDKLKREIRNMIKAAEVAAPK